MNETTDFVCVFLENLFDNNIKKNYKTIKTIIITKPKKNK